MDDPQAVELDRIRRAAFTITSAFEGSKSYENYQNYDAGIISYGRFQFTLADGALVQVVNFYLAASTSGTASQIRAYQARIQARDAALRNDETLKNLLIMAASEPAMRAAQDRVVMQSYWAPARDSITSRGIVLPLSQALIFDMAIQHGPANKLTQNAEAQLGAPPKSMLGQNGLNEQQLITQVVTVRRDYLYEFAEKNNLPGVKKRADFWVALVASGDWQLQGDASGNVTVYNRSVQVRRPSGEMLPDPTFPPGTSMPPPPQIPAPPAPSAPDIPAVDAGQPTNGTFVTSEVLPIYNAPSTRAVLKERVPQGKVLIVTRQYMPSPNEEWLLTEMGWVARRLESVPGAVFGSLTAS